MTDTVKLPKGVTVHAQGQKWRGEIPATFCPKKYAPKPKASKHTRDEAK
jgi:hypothetical protein